MMPLTVPQSAHKTFSTNFELITHGTNRLLLFSGDHEHLNTTLDMPEVSNNPAHLFAIASKASIGAFSAHLGLLARYAGTHVKTPFIVSLSGDTCLAPTNAHSHALYSVDDVVAFAAQSKLTIAGIHCTVYPGSPHEGAMLHTAAQLIKDAHHNGLVAVVSMHPAPNSIKDVSLPEALACAASAATSLGADFVILSPAAIENPGEQAQTMRPAVGAAGNTGVLCAGGPVTTPDAFITQVNAQLSIAGARGIAVGRNIYQRSVSDAVALCESLSTLVYGKK